MSRERPASDWPPTQMLEVEHGFSAADSEERRFSPGPGPARFEPWDPATLQRTASRFDAALGEVVPVLLWTLWLWRVRQWSAPPAPDSVPATEGGFDYATGRARLPAVREVVIDAVSRLGCEAALGEGLVAATELRDLSLDPESLVRVLQRFRYAQRSRDKEHCQIERCRVELDADAGIDRDVCTPCEAHRRIELGGEDYRTALSLTVMLAETTPAGDGAAGTITGVVLSDAERARGGASRSVEASANNSPQQAVAQALFPILSVLGVSLPPQEESLAATRLLAELASDGALERFRGLARWLRGFRRSDPESPRNRLIDWMVPELTATHSTGRYTFELSFRLYLRTRLRSFLVERGAAWHGASALDEAFTRLTRDSLGQLLSAAVRDAVDRVDEVRAYSETGLTPTSIRATRELLATSA